MTTIKLKDNKSKEETVYKAGQFFKSNRRGLLVLCRPQYNSLALAGIEENYAYYFADNSKWLNKNEAKLSELQSFFETDLTPINVTISED